MRFGFGKNWQNFLQHLNQENISIAETSLKEYLKIESLTGKTFLDIGSGSGLFSLVARRLNATVHSFDYDQASVDATKSLQNKFYPQDTAWTIEQGDILSTSFLSRLQKYDVVYSWGVLHHTGSMYQALDNAASLVKPGGTLFISIYNDQGRISKGWYQVKRLYNQYRSLRLLVLLAVFLRAWGPNFIKDFVKSGNPLKSWFQYKKNRGMSAWYDVVDWAGGYPFEVAKPEVIFDFYAKRGFTLQKLKTCAGGLGCNEYVFSYDQKKPVVDIASGVL